MKILIGILREILGLFVEDLGYSIVIGLWVGFVAAFLSRGQVSLSWRGPVLFLGVVLVLLENVTRSLRRGKVQSVETRCENRTKTS
ncbi:MAG: hypothetical protein JWM32_1470 [Verrucomicrobia bacterium]|nr:hypothetical protein [Verrucomicrobiota bacterium]